MKKRPVLSIAPYYGGKARMAHFIADRLDYEHTDIFISPFGGMCRVLLNKPRHMLEFYNELDAGLVALIKVLSNPEEADELIHRLEEETEYSREEFERQKEIYEAETKDIEFIFRKKLAKYLVEGEIVKAQVANRFITEIMEGKEEEKKKATSIQKGKEKLKKADEKYKKQVDDDIESLKLIEDTKKNGGISQTTGDTLYTETTPMELAIATYVVYQQSMDGMGKAWSKSKFKTDQEYKRKISQLYVCAERLEGVEVLQIDANFFMKNDYEDGGGGYRDFLDEWLGQWINNPRVMMYCDPSYISVDDEEKQLEGIDIENTSCLSEKIREENRRLPRNLGSTYTGSSDYEDHENFLRYIQNARCRIMVSNYDLKLYNKYLNESTGWHKEEFPTTTSVGGKKDNKRVEVIWYNY